MLSETRKLKNAHNIGGLIKEAREKSGFTQKALAEAIGLDYYTMISQMELGYVSVPPALWVVIARTLDMGRVDFVLRCILAYQPDLYEALFDRRGRSDVCEFLTKYIKGHFDSDTPEAK